MKKTLKLGIVAVLTATSLISCDDGGDDTALGLVLQILMGGNERSSVSSFPENGLYYDVNDGSSSSLVTLPLDAGRPPKALGPANAEWFYYDPVEDFIYYSGASYDPFLGVIERSRVDGSDHSVIMKTGTMVFDIAVDSQNGKLYWLESTVIRRANIDGSNPEKIHAFRDRVKKIALDVEHGRILFVRSQIGSSQVWRMDLNGASAIPLCSTSYNAPSDVAHIAYNAAEQMLYFSDHMRGTVSKAPPVLYCSITSIASAQRNLGGIAVDSVSNSVYWIAEGASEEQVIQKSDHDGSSLVLFQAGIPASSSDYLFVVHR